MIPTRLVDHVSDSDAIVRFIDSAEFLTIALNMI